MKPLRHHSLRIVTILIAEACCNEVFAADLVYKCDGEVVESYTGSAVMATGREFRRKDSLVFVLSSKRVKLVGPTEIPVAQEIDDNRNTKLGYTFTVCERDRIQASFNNFACNRKKNTYSGFTEYEGEFNRITGRLQILIYNTTPSRELDANWSANYSCKLSK